MNHFSGLNNIIAIAQKTQNRLTMKKQKQNLDRINNTKISRDHSINYAEDEPDKQDYEEVDEDNMMNQSIVSNNPLEQSFDLFALEHPQVTNTNKKAKKQTGGGWLKKTKAKKQRDDLVR